MFWYYIRDNFKTLIIGGLIGLLVIVFLINYINKDISNKTQNLTPIEEQNTEEIQGSIYDKYVDESEKNKKENANKNTDYNATPIANSLKQSILELDTLMTKRSQEIQKEFPVMESDGVELYKLLNDSDYKDMVATLSAYVSEGNVKPLLQLYGFGIKNGQICHQEGENKNSYKVNTQYPMDVIYASNNSAEVIVPLTKNGSPNVIFSENNNLSSTEQVGVKNTEKDYSSMKTVTYSFKKQHGRWIIYNIVFK